MLQACVKRIHGDDSGQKHCTGQYFDYWYCVDKCVSINVQFENKHWASSFAFVFPDKLKSWNAGCTKAIRQTEVTGEYFGIIIYVPFYLHS